MSCSHPAILTLHTELSVFTGVSVIQGCDCSVQQGGVATIGLCSEKPLQGCNGGKLF